MMKRTGIDLAGFLANAPSLFGEEATIDEEVDPDIAHGKHRGAIRHFDFDNGDILSCVRWDSQYHITSTDIIRALVHRFQDIGRPVVNMKKFEEGVFSDLRSLKPGSDARLEPPRSEFLELLYKHHCVRTQKKQKVFYWNSVPHDLLFREALERDLKREAMGIEPTTKICDDADPNSVVEIDGVELPLSVPPTLAAHTRIKPAAASPADDASASCSKIRVSSALVSVKPNSEQGAALSSYNKQLRIPTVSSALSLDSMASLSNGEEMKDMHAVVYPDSTSSYADSIDYSSAFSAAAAAAVATNNATAVAAQGYNGINNSSSSLAGIATTQRQPSLSEYVTRKSSSQDANDTSMQLTSSVADSYDIPDGIIPINDRWTGANFLELHKQASELRKNYDEYQPTPTPHHSPKEGVVGEKELLDLLDANPNALVTPDNIGGFNALLEQLLGSSSGRIQEASSQVSGASTQGFLFGDNQPLFQPQSQSQPQQQQQFSFSQQSSLGIGAVTAGPPVNMNLGMGLAGGIGSIDSSPSVASLINAQRISPNGTPETMDALQFGGGSMPAASQAAVSASVNGGQGSSIIVDSSTISIDDIDKLIATTNSVLPPVTSDISLASQPVSSTIPVYNSSSGSPAFPPYTAPISGDSQTDPEVSKSESVLKQAWSNQKSSSTLNHRSTRFSRYHPYLRTMARIAHRDSHTLLNRVPSTADPNLAAAAVNAIAARINQGKEAANASVQGAALPEYNANMFTSSSVAQQVSKATYSSEPASSSVAMLSGSESLEPSFLANATDDPAINEHRQRSGKCGDGNDEDVRRYVCTYAGCTKQFKRHEHLKRHFRTHTGERPYKCPMLNCGKVFARMDNLNQHARTHVNRKTTHRRVGGGNANDSNAAVSVLAQQAQSETRLQQEQTDGGANEQPTQHVFSTGSSSGVPPAYGDMSLFNNGSMPSFVTGSSSALVSGMIPPGMAATSIPLTTEAASVSAAGLGGVQQNEFGASAGNMGSYNAILSASKDLSGTESQDEMRISEPLEDLAMFNRGLVVNNSGGYPQQRQQPALQSPPIENNAVSMLRKMSRNNKPRGIVLDSSLGINNGESSSTVDSAYRSRNYQQFMSALSSNAMSAFGSTVEQAGSNNGVGFGDLQQMSGGDGATMDVSSLPRSVAGEANVSSISTTWLASFLAQNQQQQQQQQQQQTTMQVNVSSPPAYLSPYSGNALIRLQPTDTEPIVRQPSLKRHLDDDEDSDVVMRSSSKDRSRQSMNVSEDEYSDGKSMPKSSSTHKFVRPNVASKPTLSPV
ncbi:hypothetical protein IW140_005761 [Coemansia sp. RSA 1813]|nr:hypothetical protein IW138_005504 [Coemansia sp. RSA 986]KAJ2212973.1 hypothetical protein EV179_004201 [Coemansia sp. RSA 487]KAJ2564394.1 hypothetical protein IW140_005761 [Coemansia sp. RSA 1813]